MTTEFDHMRVLELHMNEFTSHRDHIMRSYSDWVEGIHRVMLMAAGIGGVIVPILANRAAVTAPLRAGALYLFATVAIGVVMQFCGRYVMAFTLSIYHATVRQQYQAIGEIGASESADAIATAQQKFIDVKPPNYFVVVLGVLGVLAMLAEVAFYACFLYGAWLVVKGFAQ